MEEEQFSVSEGKEWIFMTLNAEKSIMIDNAFAGTRRDRNTKLGRCGIELGGSMGQP